MKIKMLIILLFIVFANYSSLFAQKQNKNFMDDYKNGNYIKKPFIDQYVGTWQSDDAKFTFLIKKSIHTTKDKYHDFKSDALILTLVSVKDYEKESCKILNNPLEFSNILQHKASKIFIDPTTDNEVDLILIFKSKDLIEFFTLNSILGDKRKGFYFPEKIILNKVN